MLLSNEEHEKLLNSPWINKWIDGKTYYMKYNFDIPNEYLLLLTDLNVVWFEHGNHERMKESAENELKMDLSDREASRSLLERIKPIFKEKVLRCRFQRIPGHIKILLPLDDAKSKGEITRFSWVFDCRILDQEPERHGYFTGPQVIAYYFLLPSQPIVNYFVQNLKDELQEKLKMDVPGTTCYTIDSLKYLSSLAKEKNSNNGASVSQDMIVEPVGEDEKERLKLAKEREELERKRLIEEYNLKQQTRPTVIKKKRRI